MLKIILSVVFSLIVIESALAQVADVPRADSQGEYTTGIMPGNRGEYTQLTWVNVDKDYHLNCRDQRGTIVSVFAQGWLMEAAALRGQEVIFSIDTEIMNEISGGGKWLRVKTSPIFSRGNPQTAEYCYVRAHEKYIRPVNMDSVYEYRIK